MKIAMMTNNYKPFLAGVPISIERLSQGLRELGHEVTVFAPTYKQQMVEKDVVRYRTFTEGPAGGIAIPNVWDAQIEKVFEREQFDLIHVHHPMLIGKTAVSLSKQYGIPLVFTYHTRYEQYLHYMKPMQYLKKAVPLYLKKFLTHCDHVFAPTQGMEDYLIQECGQLGDKVSVLPTGLQENSYHPDEIQRQSIRKRYCHRGEHLFISVSRLAEEKNIGFLLKSLAEYKRQAATPFKMLIVGDGPNREEYEKEVKRLQLEEEVVFAGKVANEELKNFYGAADLFLFASKTETQGIVILEAMAAGLPVIAVKAGGVEDLVYNGLNGFLVPEDTEPFARCMMDILTYNEKRMFLQAGAVKYAENFREEKIAALAAACYEQVLAPYRGEYYMPNGYTPCY